MRARALFAGSLGFAGILALLAPEASAQDEPEPLTVDYVAPEGCPAAASFFTDISSRTRRARAARLGERARVIHVRIVRRGDGHLGTLAIEDTSGTGTAREVAGGACSEVASALALVAALAVDPRASTAPHPPAETRETGAPPGTTATGPTEPPATAASGPATPPAATVQREPAPDRASKPPTPPRPDGAPRRTSFAVGAAAEIAMVADAVVSLRIFGDMDFQREGDILAPSFRIALARSLDRDKRAAIGGATLRWTQGALDGCPLRLAIGSRFALRPCLATTAGILEAAPDIGAARSRTRPWVTLGAHARAVWAPVDRLAIEAEAGVIAPLYRESFFFEPNVPVYEAPAVAFAGRFGASLRFP